MALLAVDQDVLFMPWVLIEQEARKRPVVGCMRVCVCPCVRLFVLCPLDEAITTNQLHEADCPFFLIGMTLRLLH